MPEKVVVTIMPAINWWAAAIMLLPVAALGLVSHRLGRKLASVEGKLARLAAAIEQNNGLARASSSRTTYKFYGGLLVLLLVLAGGDAAKASCNITTTPGGGFLIEPCEESVAIETLSGPITISCQDTGNMIIFGPFRITSHACDGSFILNKPCVRLLDQGVLTTDCRDSMHIIIWVVPVIGLILALCSALAVRMVRIWLLTRSGRLRRREGKWELDIKPDPLLNEGRVARLSNWQLAMCALFVLPLARSLTLVTRADEHLQLGPIKVYVRSSHTILSLTEAYRTAEHSVDITKSWHCFQDDCVKGVGRCGGTIPHGVPMPNRDTKGCIKKEFCEYGNDNMCFAWEGCWKWTATICPKGGLARVYDIISEGSDVDYEQESPEDCRVISASLTSSPAMWRFKFLLDPVKGWMICEGVSNRGTPVPGSIGDIQLSENTSLVASDLLTCTKSREHGPHCSLKEAGYLLTSEKCKSLPAQIGGFFIAEKDGIMTVAEDQDVQLHVTCTGQYDLTHSRVSCGGFERTYMAIEDSESGAWVVFEPIHKSPGQWVGILPCIRGTVVLPCSSRTVIPVSDTLFCRNAYKNSSEMSIWSSTDLHDTMGMVVPVEESWSSGSWTGSVGQFFSSLPGKLIGGGYVTIIAAVVVLLLLRK